MRYFMLPAGSWPAKAFLAAGTLVYMQPLANTFKTELIKVEYAKILAYAFESRQDADYDVAFYVDQDLAREILRDAMRFVDRIERYLHTKNAI